MNIQKKIMIPMIAVALAATIVILFVSVLVFTNYVDENMKGDIETLANVVYTQYEDLQAMAEAAARVIGNDDDFKAAFASGDQARILEVCVALQSEAGTEFTTVTDDKGIVLARAHDPSKQGDDISGQDYIKQSLAGVARTSLAKGSAVPLSIRAARPILNEKGQIVGTLSTGFRLDTVTFVDRMKAQTNAEITVFLGDTRLSTTVTNADGTRATGTPAAETISKKVLAGNEHIGAAQVLGRDALAKYVPLKDADGNVLGMLFVGRYTTEKTTAIWNFVFQGGLVAFAILAISIAVSIWLARRITKPIKTMVHAAEVLSKGSVDIRVDVNTKDEMAQLAVAFNKMIEHSRLQADVISAMANGDMSHTFTPASEKDVIGNAIASMLDNNNDVFAKISDSAERVALESRQISSAAQTLAEGATEQASVVEQLSASIIGIADKARDNASLATQAAALADTIKVNAQDGSAKMRNMTKAVNEINNASQSISNVIKVIDDIAFQTNILALNAAVEAARAGEAGKGFAVVADEVRNLAGKSAEAAKNTSALIEDSMKKAHLGAQIAAEAEKAFADIVSGINNSGRIVGEIATSSTDTSENIAQITSGMEQVAQVVQQNSATSEESAAASDQMSAQADVLRNMVDRFKLR